MKSAYLYVRVSTDEQKRKGYSLVEQEDRLIKHCEIHVSRLRAYTVKIIPLRILTGLNGKSSLGKSGKTLTGHLETFYSLNGIVLAGISNMLTK